MGPGEYDTRMKHQILEGYCLTGAVVYVDDTVIYGENEKNLGNVRYGSRENGPF